VIEVQSDQGITILRLPACKWQDDNVAKSVCDEIIHYVDMNKPKNLIFDFTRVNVYRDMLGRPLFLARREVNDQGGRLLLAAMDEEVFEVFKIFHLDRVLDVAESVEVAVKQLRD